MCVCVCVTYSISRSHDRCFGTQRKPARNSKIIVSQTFVGEKHKCTDLDKEEAEEGAYHSMVNLNSKKSAAATSWANLSS